MADEQPIAPPAEEKAEKPAEKKEEKNKEEKKTEPVKPVLTKAQKKAELERQKEELDEQQGKTLKGKLIVFLAFWLVLFAGLGILYLLIKKDVGGFASQLMEPTFGGMKIFDWLLPDK